MSNMREMILYVVFNLQNQNQSATFDALIQPLSLLECSRHNLKDEVEWLISHGLLAMNQANEYVLTDQGGHQAAQIHKVRSREEFGRMIDQAGCSAAYLDYCGEVHGWRLPLFNMMDKDQLDFVFESIPVISSDTVLDIGCGSGSMLNYLVKKYNCFGIGVDQIEPPIDEQNDLLKYIACDIDDLSKLQLNPSISLSIDSLYFSTNLESLICNLCSILKNRLYLFYSQYIFDPAKNNRETLHADHTRLASALQKNAVNYKTVDFSLNERLLYETGLTVLPKYLNSFSAEGNIQLYEAKLRECTVGKSLYEQGLASRYLYIVEPFNL